MHKSSFEQMRRFVLGYLDPELSLKILDVGSLTKGKQITYRRLFKKPGWRYAGVDLKAGPNVDVVLKSLYDWPIPDGDFDVVISGQVAEHVLDLHAWIREIYRVATPGAWVCIIAPWTWQEHRHPVDCWRILPDGMRFLLKTVGGFSVRDVIKTGTDTVGIAQKLWEGVIL